MITEVKTIRRDRMQDNVKKNKKTILMSALSIIVFLLAFCWLKPTDVRAEDSSGVVKAENLNAESPVFEYIYKQLMEKNTVIDVSRFRILLGDSDSYADYLAREIYGAVLNEYADVSWSSTCTIDLSKEEEGYFFKTLNVTYVEDEYDMDAFYAARDEALSLITPEMDDLQKALVLHDYIVSKAAYDSWAHVNDIPPRNDYKAYGALVDHLAVCEGLSLAYKYLCNQAGLKCYITDSSTMQHGWNTVVIDGEAYEVDLTADNPCYDTLGRVWHEAAFVSETKAKEWPGHMADRNVHSYNSIIDLPATSTKYEDAFWTTVTSPIYYYKGNYYYSIPKENAGSRIRACIVSRPADLSGKETVLYNIFCNRDAVQEALPWGEGYIVKIEGDRVYFGTMTTYSSVDITGQDARDEYVIDTGDKVIYGIAELDGQVYYTLGNFIFPDGKETYILLSEDDRVYFPEPEPTITPEPTATPEPTVTPEITPTSKPAITSEPTVTPAPSLTPVVEVDGGESNIIFFIIIGVAILALVVATIIVLAKKKK